MIEDKISQEIIRTIRDMLKSFRIKTYDEDTGYGLLRHVLVRRGFSTDEIMVVLVIGSPIFPSKNNFVKALRKKYPQITTVVLNVNDKKTSMVLGERDIVIYGKGYIRDTLCGCTFRISPLVFLSGKSTADMGTVFQGSGICRSSRRGNSVGSLLRHWNHLSFLAQKANLSAAWKLFLPLLKMPAAMHG